MGFIGRKISHIAHRIGTKARQARKIGLKVTHTVHKGLHTVGKIAGKVESVAGKIHKGADKLSGIPIIGAVAGVASAGAHEVQTLAHLGKKGVHGMEKKVSKIEKAVKKHSKHASDTFRRGTTLAIKKSDIAEKDYHNAVHKAKSKMKAGKTRIRDARETIHNEIHDARNNAKKFFS